MANLYLSFPALSTTSSRDTVPNVPLALLRVANWGSADSSTSMSSVSLSCPLTRNLELLALSRERWPANEFSNSMVPSPSVGFPKSTSKTLQGLLFHLLHQVPSHL